ALILSATESWFSETEPIRLPGPYELSLRPGRVQEPLRVRDGQLYLLRILMAAHWVLLSVFLLALADLLWPDWPRFSFGLAVCLASIPQAALGGASFTPDTPTALFSLASFYFLVRGALRRDSSRSSGLKAGSFLALALLSKSAAVHLLPVVLLAAVLRGRKRPREALGFLAWVLVVPLLSASWWYLRNLLLYGDIFQMRAQIETFTHAIRREPLTGAFYEAFADQLFHSFFGFYDEEVLLPRPVYYLLAAVLGVALAGNFALLRRPIRAEASHAELCTVPMAWLAFVTMLGLTFYGNLRFFSPQGRYLFPALGALLVLLGTGLRVGLRLRSDGRIWYAVAGAWLLFGLWAFHWAVLPKKAVERRRAGGEGQVLFYEDCGTPSLHPHRLQGYDNPDQGQLGRISSWRTLDGHPSAVIYRFPLEAEQRGLQVRVLYFNPDLRTPYVAASEGRFVYPAQRLLANGHILHQDIEITSTPRELFFPLPDRWLEGGELELRFEKSQGEIALVSEIWIEKSWLRYDRGRIHNRSSRALPFVLLWKRGDRTGRVEGSLAAGETREVGPADESMLLPGRHAPWSLREAESGPLVEWFGDIEASGAYRLRGTGLLARLSFPEMDGRPAAFRGSFLARVKGVRGSWTWRKLEDPRIDKGLLEVRSLGRARESLDYVLVYGAWPAQ
ncbi:MAG: ArnT family glycosyltransferase, partial [Planctomycetota bacterium]